MPTTELHTAIDNEEKEVDALTRCLRALEQNESQKASAQAKFVDAVNSKGLTAHDLAKAKNWRETAVTLLTASHLGIKEALRGFRWVVDGKGNRFYQSVKTDDGSVSSFLPGSGEEKKEGEEDGLDENGMRALHRAAAGNEIEIAMEILKDLNSQSAAAVSEALNERDFNGRIPRLHAIRNGHEIMAELLLICSWLSVEEAISELMAAQRRREMADRIRLAAKAQAAADARAAAFKGEAKDWVAAGQAWAAEASAPLPPSLPTHDLSHIISHFTHFITLHISHHISHTACPVLPSDL